MELQLKNIGMIKEANVKIDGLTVIAGENDTGKSTVGKALYLLIKSSPLNPFKINPDELVKRIFKKEGAFFEKAKLTPIDRNSKDIIFIETPLVWNFTDFFRDIAQIESQMRIELDYPYLMNDLNFKLHIKNAAKGIDIKEKMIDLMGGEFKKDEMGRYYFDKKGQKIELVNVATGIKYFGIFQVLSQNNYLIEDIILILDEPEVHLHPKWQLEMAKVIVNLVKNDVKIVVNSHSPYIIEALKIYSDKENLQDKTNFYLAENGVIEDKNKLQEIYEKLSEPYDEFDQIDSDILNGK